PSPSRSASLQAASLCGTEAPDRQAVKCARSLESTRLSPLKLPMRPAAGRGGGQDRPCSIEVYSLALSAKPFSQTSRLLLRAWFRRQLSCAAGFHCWRCVTSVNELYVVIASFVAFSVPRWKSTIRLSAS